LGHVSGVAINWWNVMEFTLGFCGGLGMAYGVFTRSWPEGRTPSPLANGVSIVFLLTALPATNLLHAFDGEKFMKMAETLGVANPAAFASWHLSLGWLTILVFTVCGLLIWRNLQSGVYLLFAYSVYYTLFSHIRKGFLAGAGGVQLEQYFYWVVLIATAVIWYLIRKQAPPFASPEPEDSWKKWTLRISAAFLIIVVATLVAINSHGELGGVQERF
jgi:hypothetical protein